MDYSTFIVELDKKLDSFFYNQKEYICCQMGCSDCCEKGDYPISEPELRYLMQGFAELDNETKIKVQQNVKKMEKGGACPFLIDKLCSVYAHRPIVCRIHGLAYLNKNGIVKLPYCVNNGKNYTQVYKDGEFSGTPIQEDLDRLINLGDVRKLYDWIKQL